MLRPAALGSLSHAVTTIPEIAAIKALSLNHAYCQIHVGTIYQCLEDTGALRIGLEFDDDDCLYLRGLIQNLHTRHSHSLPLNHSAHRGWFWDIRPSQTTFQCPKHQARSETMEKFPWHTDCSYEASPPRFFALQVLHPDHYGGGILSLLRCERVLGLLSGSSVAALAQPEYAITVPPEFRKLQNADTSIVGCLLALQSGQFALRYREDITRPLTREATVALEELKAVLRGPRLRSEMVHLAPEMLPRRSIVIVDNRRWLHRRTEIQDPNRHLKRVRWDAKLFPALPRRDCDQ